jgi:soluble lytic murein transglycosylase-like protein
MTARIAFGFLVACGTASAAEHVYVALTAQGIPLYTNQPRRGGAISVMTFTIPLRPSMRAGKSGLRTQRAARLRGAPLDTAIDSLIRLAAATYHVEERLLRSVIEVESGFNPAARSERGAMGLMQLMPDTARRFGVIDAYDPVQNIDAGTRYLKSLLQMFDGDVRLALAAYNAGEDSVLRYGRRVPPFAETQAYVTAVLTRLSNAAFTD